MKLIAVIIGLFSVTVAAFAQLEERPIHTNGIVSLEIFPGPPNYESIKNGDAQEKAWILTTVTKERFQLVIIDELAKKFKTLRGLIGKEASVTGTVWEANTGDHHTPLLITVSAIGEAPNKAPESAPILVTPRADALVAPVMAVAHPKRSPK